jgi:hypothetical protein
MFQFRLAKDLGKTATELRNTITAWEFLLWAEFYDREHKAVKALHHQR